MSKSTGRLSKKLSLGLLGVASLGVIGVGTLGLGSVSAERDGEDNLATRIAEKFNLNKDDVSTELKNFREERRVEREAQMDEELNARLQAKVDDGSITLEQKESVLIKLKERRDARQAEKEANRGSSSKPSREEMESKREAERTEVEAWLKSEGINLELKDIVPERKDNKRGGRT